MADRLDDLEVFLHAARMGSLTAAARALGISTTAASRRLAALEERLGVSLLERTTRQLHLTAAGQLYRLEAQKALSALCAVEEALLEARDTALVGVVSLSADAALFRVVLEAKLHEFLHHHPDVALRLHLGGARSSGEEVWVGLGPLSSGDEDPAVVQYPLLPCGLQVCAAPAWVLQYGVPRDPASLPPGEALMDGHLQPPLVFRARTAAGEEVEQALLPSSRLSVNDFDAVARAAAAGLGYAVLPSVVAAEPLQQGRLVSLLPEWQAAPAYGVVAVVSVQALVRAPVRALLDVLIGHRR